MNVLYEENGQRPIRLSGKRLSKRVRSLGTDDPVKRTVRIPLSGLVINNQNEFVELCRSFTPAPADVLVPSAMDESMYDDLWQVARDHPGLLEGWNGETPPSIDRILDLVVLKKPA